MPPSVSIPLKAVVVILKRTQSFRDSLQTRLLMTLGYHFLLVCFLENDMLLPDRMSFPWYSPDSERH